MFEPRKTVALRTRRHIVNIELLLGFRTLFAQIQRHIATTTTTMTGDYSGFFYIFIIFSQDLGDALRATDDPSDWLIGGNGRSNSHVVLHDRLMTDALLGNAPIKAEHSYCTTHGSRESLDDAIGEW